MQYMSIDKNAINVILKNSKNLTHRANILVHTHGYKILSDIDKASSKVAKNTDLVDSVRKIVYDIQQPLTQIKNVVTYENSVDVKKTLNQVSEIVGKINAIEVNRLIGVVIEFLEKIMKSMSPEMVKELVFIADKFNAFVSNDNTEKMENIVHDTDESMKSFTRIIDLFSKVPKQNR